MKKVLSSIFFAIIVSVFFSCTVQEPPVCKISVICAEPHGSASVDHEAVPLGTFVKLTVKPDDGYKVGVVTSQYTNTIITDSEDSNVFYVLADTTDTVITVSFDIITGYSNE